MHNIIQLYTYVEFNKYCFGPEKCYSSVSKGILLVLKTETIALNSTNFNNITTYWHFNSKPISIANACF